LTRSDNIKDAVNSFVMSLEEEQKNEKIVNIKVEKEEAAQNIKSNQVKSGEIHNDGIEILADILKKTIEIITMDKEIRIEPDKEKSSIAVYGRDLSIVIGKNGRNMDALEYLINLIGKRKKLIEKNVVLDIKDYRKNNDEKIKKMAICMAQKALKEGRRIALRPMPSHERKIVHNILSKVKNIKTRSRDDEPNRRIVIYPAIKE